jgi:hypothetical protein
MVIDDIVVVLRWGTKYLMGAASATIAKIPVVCGYDCGRSSRRRGVTARRISFGRGACRNKGDLGDARQRSSC